MTEAELLTRVRGSIASLAELPVDQIGPTADLSEMEQLDSLAFMDVLVTCEDELGVVIPADQIVGSDVSTPRRLAATILRFMDGAE